MRLPVFLAAAVGAAAVLPEHSLAQSSIDSARAAVDQSFEAPRGAPAASSDKGVQAGDFAPAMEGDEEFGVQRILYRRSNWEPFTFRYDLMGNYTSNVALSSRGEEDDFFLRTGALFNYTPQITGGLFFTGSAAAHTYRYAEASFFDFDLLQADAGLLYATPQQGTAFDPLLGDLTTSLRYGYYRITDTWEWDDALFDNHSLLLNVHKVWRLSRGHQAYAGLGADWSLDASSELARRDEYSAYVGYRIKWTASLETSLQYRAAWYDYSRFGRDDFNQIVALSAEYRFNDWLRAAAYLSGTFNNSDREVFDYEAFGAGLGLALVVTW